MTEMRPPYWLIEYPTETKEYLVSQSEQSISPFQFWAGCSSQSISNYHNIKYNIDVIRSIVLCERCYMINTLKLSNSCVIYYSSIAPAHSIQICIKCITRSTELYFSRTFINIYWLHSEPLTVL